jgi:hypothetical protein
MHYQMIQPGIIQNMSNVPNGFSARVLKKVRALQPEELAQIQNIQPIQNQLPSPSRLM